MATTALPALAAAGDRPGERRLSTWPLLAPSVGVLLLWMIVPLVMTLWFSVQRYNLLDPTISGFAGFDNYAFLLTDPALGIAMLNTLLLVGGVIAATIILGTLLAVLFNEPFFGRTIARLLVIAPFFVMPTVSALVWKNLLMNPVNGLFASIAFGLGLDSVDFFGSIPLLSIGAIVAWQWTPFALLILLTAMQSLDSQQIEAARVDGASPVQMFFYVILPHLGRAISVVIMIEMIFFLTIFAEIYTTTSGGPGLASTNLAFLIYLKALREFDIGGASAGGVIAIVLANIVAVFLVRSIARNLDS